MDLYRRKKVCQVSSTDNNGNLVEATLLLIISYLFAPIGIMISLARVLWTRVFSIDEFIREDCQTNYNDNLIATIIYYFGFGILTIVLFLPITLVLLVPT